jgi:hypothetical protein
MRSYKYALKIVWSDGEDWIEVVQDRHKRQGLVNAVMNLSCNFIDWSFNVIKFH